MKKHMSYTEARDMLLRLATPVKTENIPLEECFERVLATRLTAAENVPEFDRSPYDGYAFMASDTIGATAENPVVLRVLEEIPAGDVPTCNIVSGTAVRLMTGAPIPKGADAVIMYEQTQFTDSTVKIFSSVKSGSNIVYAGEDVKKGQLLAEAGAVIDSGLMGTLASQGIAEPEVYCQPVIGVISTGNEITEVGMPITPGKIFNSNRYTVASILANLGCKVKYLGLARDGVEEISDMISEGISHCDAVLLTGGVSAGDYDLTPDAMERSGVELLARGVDLKPGMACAYGIKDGTLVCGLSGNPAASVTNLYGVVLPAIKKLCGYAEIVPPEITLTLGQDFNKKSKGTRLLRGRMEIVDGTAVIHVPDEQGNVVLSSMIGCNAIAVVPAGSGALKAGTRLKGFMI